MPIGNMLGVNEQQYVALKDESSGLWRVLNTWHEDLKNLNADDDIPDDSEAVTTLSEGQFIALIKEAGRLGVLANATFGTGEAELEAEILNKDQEIQKLHEKILKLEEEKSEVVRNASHTEDYELKEKAMNNILKLVSMQDVSNLSSQE
tara:strand:+ start:2311 stop:2757 length:447 start_codon:yes stop_codon:yes gene_type:complete